MSERTKTFWVGAGSFVWLVASAYGFIFGGWWHLIWISYASVILCALVKDTSIRETVDIIISCAVAIGMLVWFVMALQGLFMGWPWVLISIAFAGFWFAARSK